MSKGISLHIGLNYIDPEHYAGWDGKLSGCENDARAMQEIARKQKFEPTLLLNEEATAEAVQVAISIAAGKLQSGDTFLITYSGHGGQVPDSNGDERDDGYDETWLLYDREVVDDELYTLWGRFAAGVRILLLSDSCHSGSVAREYLRGTDGEGKPPANLPPPRTMTEDVAEKVYRANQELYDQIQTDYASSGQVAVQASLVQISACQDNQVARDGLDNGYFTGALLQVWDDGQFQGGLGEFHSQILSITEDLQRPNYLTVGVANGAFEGERPFTI